MHSSFHYKNKVGGQGLIPPTLMAGFTLIELMISIAIISIVTAIVLVKYSSFDSTVLLKSAAYEIALTLREAQVKSVSVSRNDGSGKRFDYPFGVSFTPDSKTYRLFQFGSENKTLHPNPFYDVDTVVEPDEPIAKKLQDFTMQRSIYIKNICLNLNDNTVRCAIDGTGSNNFERLDVAFRRPEFKALFYAVDAKGDEPYKNAIMSASIQVTSPSNSTSVFAVEISNLGQITVDICDVVGGTPNCNL